MEEIAMKNYNKYLKVISKHLGTAITYGDDLHEIGTMLFGHKFLGVFARDQIPKKYEGYCIVNLDTSAESGSHWIAIVFNKGKSIVYDSFGRSASEMKVDVKAVVNTDLSDREQKLIEDTCGQRCLAWLTLYHKKGVEKAMLI